MFLLTAVGIVEGEATTTGHGQNSKSDSVTPGVTSCVLLSPWVWVEPGTGFLSTEYGKGEGMPLPRQHDITRDWPEQEIMRLAWGRERGRSHGRECLWPLESEGATNSQPAKIWGLCPHRCKKVSSVNPLSELGRGFCPRRALGWECSPADKCIAEPEPRTYLRGVWTPGPWTLWSH